MKKGIHKMKKDRKLKEKWDIPKKGDNKMKKVMLSNICIIYYNHF